MNCDILFRFTLARSICSTAIHSATSPQNCVNVLPGIASLPNSGKIVSNTIPDISKNSAARNHLPNARIRLTFERAIIYQITTAMLSAASTV